MLFIIYFVIAMISLLSRSTVAFAPPKIRQGIQRPLASRIVTFATRTPLPQRIASNELLDLFSNQVNEELSNSQLYLSASIWCDSRDLNGMASFMRNESDEERGHALEFVDFAMKRNIPISLEELEAPATDWDTVEDLWAAILQAEMDNTQLLLVLGDAASQCNDHAVSTFLQPFHLEQINSEDNLRTILAKVQDENKTPGLLRQLDSELGQDTSGSSKS